MAQVMTMTDKERAAAEAEFDKQEGRRDDAYMRPMWDMRQQMFIAGFAAGLAHRAEWTEDDLDIPEDTEIRFAHPLHTQNHERYAEAMRLVGAKRSKYALVDLVNWLLKRIDDGLAHRGYESWIAWYLLRFSYYDWDIGEDDKLRVGDFVECNRQDHNGTDVANFPAKIAIHHTTGVPVLLINLDKNGDGDYVDIQSAYMEGYEFKRVTAYRRDEG
jgi:hypothetical protein